MKNKILSFLLVITMIMATPLSVLAEDIEDKGLDTTSEINIEKNSNIIDSDECSISEEELDGNKEEIFEPTFPSEEDSVVIKEETTEQEPIIEDLPEEEPIIEEPVVEEPEGIPSEDSAEFSNNEGTSGENNLIEENLVEPGSVEEDIEGIVEEVVDEQLIEEQPVNTIFKEPEIFFVSEGLTLTRAADALTLQGYYPCKNNTGVDVKLVAIQVISLNDWVMVSSDVDFKNSREGLKEFRLTVNGQVIDYTFENDVALIEDQVELLNGAVVDIPVEIEIGPFKEGFNDSVLSLVLVFEEIVDEEVIEEVEGVVSEEPINNELGSSSAGEQESIDEGSENFPVDEQEVVNEDVEDLSEDEPEIEDEIELNNTDSETPSEEVQLEEKQSEPYSSDSSGISESTDLQESIPTETVESKSDGGVD